MHFAWRRWPVSIRRVLAVLLILLLLGAAALVALAWRPEIDPVAPPDRASFDTALIEKGAHLARIGNCISCHTAQGGKPYAGGRPLQTPFGVLYGTNITPDPGTGIGRWSKAAFVRSMREGVDREGRHLYPAFPYDHFTLMSDEDLAALYGYFMTRLPVQAESPDPELPFPFNVRMTLAAWKLLFLDERRFQPDSAQSAEWNRGAYLAEGPAHCGACHTPRNFLGAEKKSRAYAGGESGGWHAPALNQASPAPSPWSPQALFAYLRHGRTDSHSVPAGPMAPVVRNLEDVPEADVRAMAIYVASLNPNPANGGSAAEGATARQAVAPSSGEAIYAGACASCHDAGRDAGGALRLALSSEVALPTPRNLIHIIRDGISPPEGERGPWMPGYAGALTEPQLADLVRYLRSEFGRRPAWDNLEEEVRKISRGER